MQLTIGAIYPRSITASVLSTIQGRGDLAKLGNRYNEHYGAEQIKEKYIGAKLAVVTIVLIILNCGLFFLSAMCQELF